MGRFETTSLDWIAAMVGEYLKTTQKYRALDNSVNVSFVSSSTTGFLKSFIDKSAQGTGLQVLQDFTEARPGRMLHCIPDFATSHN